MNSARGSWNIQDRSWLRRGKRLCSFAKTELIKHATNKQDDQIPDTEKRKKYIPEL